MAPESNEASRPEPRIRILPKTILYIVIWLAALLATNPSLEFAALAYLFPLGLAAFVNLRLGNDGGWWVLGFCYGIYIVHAVFYFRSNTTRSTILWLGLLVIILTCNVSGCRAQLPR
ncbi:MAG TPA: hypothetical protein VJ719_14520 [Chthoniobacterales bacterium]|nr:hypothetical protein [Chthoniobacterales bacterium]